MDPENSIEVKNVTKSFTIRKILTEEEKKKSFIRKDKKINKVILDDLNFNIKKGEIVGLIGKNGAGKSTLLKLISKILDPDNGSIELSGTLAAVLELGMGFHKDMSGRENIIIKGEMYGFTKKELEKKMDSIIDYAGIREFIDNPVRTYSSGMRGRLAFSIMTHVDAEIILVDEILSTGDAAFSAKAKEHFRKMSNEGHTVIIVSHTINLIEDMCNRTIWIDKGKVKMDGPSKDVCAQYKNAINEDPEIVADLAKSGVPESQYKLALMYRDGNRIEKNDELYRKWLILAANNKHKRAEIEYANILFAEGNVKDAVHYYKDAAKRGEDEARIKLASLMSTDDINTSRNEIKDVFGKMIENGNPQNEYRFADLLLKTAWTNDDKTESFKWFKKSADDGNINGMYQTGLMYRDGIGTEKDNAQMEIYLSKAADLGHVKSMTILADYYMNGGVLQRDESKAFVLLEKAASLNDNMSRFKIAMSENSDDEKSEQYFNEYSDSILRNYYSWAAEEMVSSDFEKSVKFFERAAEFGSIPAICSMLNVYHCRNEKDKFDRMLDKLKLFAVNGNIDAIKKLGDFYNNGTFFEKNEEEAIRWYRLGCERNIPSSMRMLGKIYQGREEYDEAVKWYGLSADKGNIQSIADVMRLTYGKDPEKYAKALTMLTNWAEFGNPEAMGLLGDAYMNGKFADKNEKLAIEWYRKGSANGNSRSIEQIKKYDKEND